MAPQQSLVWILLSVPQNNEFILLLWSFSIGGFFMSYLINAISPCGNWILNKKLTQEVGAEAALIMTELSNPNETMKETPIQKILSIRIGISEEKVIFLIKNLVNKKLLTWDQKAEKIWVNVEKLDTLLSGDDYEDA